MTKKGKDPVAGLVQSIFKGSVRAARLFDKATGGCRLDQACEYLLTASVFERLAQHDRGYVHLEVPVGWANKEAKAVRCGPPSAADRKNGRYDIVHYWANEKPRAAIEIKTPIKNMNKQRFRGDFGRLTNTLKASDKSSYQFCAFVFYATKDYGNSKSSFELKRKNAKDKLNALMDEIDSYASEFLAHRGGPLLIRRLYKSPLAASKDEDEGVWQIGLVIFARKSQAATFTEDMLG